MGTAETSDAASIRIDSEEKQCVVADEDVEDIVELSTADPTDIDEMVPPPEMKIPPTADTLDIDEMDPSENVVPATTTGTLLDINEILGPPEKRKPFPGWLANIDEFVNSLIVPDDFILDESGLGLIHIKGIDIKHISVKVLRKICVRFKVSGYRNGKKDSTISLIVRLLKRDWLVGQLYPPTPMITYNEVIGIHNNNRNNDESIIEDEENSCGNVDMDSDCSQKGKPDEAEKDPDYVLNSQNSSDDDDKSLTLPPPVAKKATKKKKATVAKSTPPSSVTCANTYFRVINVYMCEQHRSDVLMLGQPPTMAELDVRKFRHKYIFDRLITTFLDDEDDDSNNLAFSQDPYWEQMGIDNCYPKTYDTLSSVEFSMAMGYINYHYQIAYRNNKKSGSHDDFVNFVGSRPYIYYYHLWLCQVPHLLNFAVPLLPKSSFRESTDSAKSSSLSSKTVGSKKGKCSSTSSNLSHHSSSMVQMANALECFERVNAVKLQVLVQSSAAPRREKEILDVLDLYKSRLKNARKDLEELENHGYDSNNSDVVQARLEIKICKRKRDHYFHLLSEGETSD